jgi:hypothetical protein
MSKRGRGSWQPRPFFLPLFTRVRGIGILRSSLQTEVAAIMLIGSRGTVPASPCGWKEDKN